MTRMTQTESKKLEEANKLAYVTQERVHQDLQKLKREVDKKVKTGLEEAKFDTIQLKDKYMETAKIIFLEVAYFMLYLEHNYM